jgi:hypothetical protein
MLQTDTCVVIWIDGVEVIGYVVAQYQEDGVNLYDIDTDGGLQQGIERDRFVLFMD